MKLTSARVHPDIEEPAARLARIPRRSCWSGSPFLESRPHWVGSLLDPKIMAGCWLSPPYGLDRLGTLLAFRARISRESGGIAVPRGLRRLRLIGSWNGSKRDCHAVPPVDGNHGQREVDQFGFGELAPDALIYIVGDMVL
jgi:hypothetical protein